MSDIPKDLRYTKDHEWVRVSGETATVGITQFAANQLGDIVMIELPEVGRRIDAGDELGTLESVKAVSELFSPVSGTIARINDDVRDAPEDANTDPYGTWLVEITLTSAGELDELLSADQYADFIKEE